MTISVIILFAQVIILGYCVLDLQKEIKRLNKDLLEEKKSNLIVSKQVLKLTSFRLEDKKEELSNKKNNGK